MEHHHISLNFILKSHIKSCPKGSLHRSLEGIRPNTCGATLKTLNIENNSTQDISYDQLTHLPGDRTTQILLGVRVGSRLSLLARRDIDELLGLQVGSMVFYGEEPVRIKTLGPLKTQDKGWFYLIVSLNNPKAMEITSLDNLSLTPSKNRHNLDNKNYANSYYHHQNSSSLHRCPPERSIGGPPPYNYSPLTPSQSYLNFSNSLKSHPLGRSRDTVYASRSCEPNMHHHHLQQPTDLLSKKEIDGQISSINNGGIVDLRSNNSRYESRDPEPWEDRSSSLPLPSRPSRGGHEMDLTYSTVVKEDNNQKRTARFIPGGEKELSFTTALNILEEEERASSRSSMKDYQSVGSSPSRAPPLNNININQSREEELRDRVGGPSIASTSSSSEKVLHHRSPHEAKSVTSLEAIKALNCELDTVSPRGSSSKSWEVGSLVEVHVQAKPLYGVIKWIGRIAPSILEFAGIELEERLEDAGNGVVNGERIFDCPEGHGIFVTFTKILKDKRFIDAEEGLNEELATMNIYENGEFSSPGEDGDFGFTDCPSVAGFIPPLAAKDLDSILGRNKGIQGYHNSCYLDSTVFAMFSFTSVFDSLLFRPPNHKDIKEYTELQKVLREDIVNPLRKNFFVRADKVMKLRKFLGSLSNVEGLTSEEKDPEELLNSLLCQTLRAKPFLHLSSGQTSHYYQLFVERDEFRQTSPTVQELFEQSFFTSDIKLTSVPSVLILQMPRFGRQFKVYDQIRPTQTLDITDIIEGAPRQCIICGNLAQQECHSCFGVHGHGLDSTAYCRTCQERTHSHKDRQHHSVRDLTLSKELMANKNVTSRLNMKLFAVLCIETSHYVTFTKCGDGPKAPWCLFDSMADRKGEANGYNIPEVSRATDLEDYFSLSESPEEPRPPLSPHVKRLLCDGYMYFYQSSEVMMYQ